MSYKALYRTYRPQVFSDVTGQEVAVKTLQNAIKNNKISHAYLFSGPRGTGKTSIARIFAKALNCVNLQDSEPCDSCTSCVEISKGYNPDVIEIDAASNNGVDEIRDIRDKVKFLPSGSKYKVYIIDEVHMLSGGAFNALLKTLEEPPKHAVFILATTEPQKLPATIISRCQRFEFKALSVAQISERLKQICEIENVEITEEALNSISESAEGAMRDALSILDQAISYGNKMIDIEDINGVTGSLSFEKIIALTTAVEERSVHQAIAILNELISSGKEVNKIVNSLLVFYRDVLLYKSVGDSGFSKFIFTKEEFKQYCETIATSKIMYFIDVLCDVQNKVKYSTTPNIFLEISLIKMCNITIEELDVMKRLSDLEEKYNSLGSFDLPADVNVTVDNEKLNTLELRVNQIINELNRLEIRKQIEKIDQLGNKISNLTVTTSENSNKETLYEIQSLKTKIEELELFINKESKTEDIDKELDEKIKVLESKIYELSNKTIDVNEKVDLTEVFNKIEEIETKVNEENDKFAEVEELKGYIQGLEEDLNTIKATYVAKENDEFDIAENELDFQEIKDKVMFLEKRLYQIIAGELSTKKVIKKDKKNSGQIMLFGEELLSINDFEQEKESYDFKDLQREKEEIEQIKALEAKPEKEEVVDVKENHEGHDEVAEETTYEVENTKVVGSSKGVTETLFTEEKEQKGLFESEIIVNVEKEIKEENITVESVNYFTVESNQEVVKTENPVIEEIRSIEKEIIEHENKSILANPSLNITQTYLSPKASSEKEVFDKFARYDIKDIEKILHDSRSIECKNDKVRIEQVWKNMSRGAKPEYLSVIETLQEGKVTVVGSKEFIIALPNVSLCNIVMRRKFKDVAIRILYNLLGESYDYVALPIDVWTSKSREYKEQYQIGIKYPTLRPLNVPGLEISQNEVDFQSKSDKTINKTLELFGKDNVEIE